MTPCAVCMGAGEMAMTPAGRNLVGDTKRDGSAHGMTGKNGAIRNDHPPRGQSPQERRAAGFRPLRRKGSGGAAVAGKIGDIDAQAQVRRTMRARYCMMILLAEMPCSSTTDPVSGRGKQVGAVDHEQDPCDRQRRRQRSGARCSGVWDTSASSAAHDQTQNPSNRLQYLFFLIQAKCSGIGQI